MAKRIGSQLRVTLAESCYRLIEYVEVGVVLDPQDGGPKELWYERDDHAGYTVDIDGIGYEFGRDLKEEE